MECGSLIYRVIYPDHSMCEDMVRDVYTNGKDFHSWIDIFLMFVSHNRKDIHMP